MPQSLTSPSRRQSPSLTVIEGGKSRQLREDDAPYDTERYVKAPCAVLFNHDLSPWARLVYFALVSHKGERGIFPRQDVIAGELGTSVDTVQRALRDLTAAGLIRSLRQGRGHANRYELVPFDTADDTAWVRYQEEESADETAPVRHPDTASTRFLETAPVRHRTISKELDKKELREETPQPPTPKETVYPPAMVAFWHAYDPRGRDRSSKKQVHDEWKRLRPDAATVAAIMDGLAAWNASPSWRDGFAPGAHRFLKLEKWKEGPSHQNGAAVNGLPVELLRDIEADRRTFTDLRLPIPETRLKEHERWVESYRQTGRW